VWQDTPQKNNKTGSNAKKKKRKRKHTSEKREMTKRTNQSEKKGNANTIQRLQLRYHDPLAKSQNIS
jgi:hypothetical protein